MSDRLKAMRRIAALQAQQKRLAEWRLATIEQRKAALDAAHRELERFVDGGELTGRLADEALQQSQRLARRAGQVDVQREAQAAVVRDADRRLKLSERATDRLAAEERAVTERRTLEALIDSLAGRREPDAP